MNTSKKIYQTKGFKMFLGITILVLASIAIFARANHISKISLWLYHDVNQGVFTDVAIEGYDPVSYFKGGSPQKGEEANAHKWNGATWLFSSAENMELFRDHPQKYAPQYGGYCSFAVSKGFTASINPEAYLLDNEKLYLFAEEKTRDLFAKDLQTMRETADNHWKKAK